MNLRDIPIGSLVELFVSGRNEKALLVGHDKNKDEAIWFWGGDAWAHGGLLAQHVPGECDAPHATQDIIELNSLHSEGFYQYIDSSVDGRYVSVHPIPLGRTLRTFPDAVTVKGIISSMCSRLGMSPSVQSDILLGLGGKAFKVHTKSVDRSPRGRVTSEKFMSQSGNLWPSCMLDLKGEINGTSVQDELATASSVQSGGSLFSRDPSTLSKDEVTDALYDISFKRKEGVDATPYLERYRSLSGKQFPEFMR